MTNLNQMMIFATLGFTSQAHFGIAAPQEPASSENPVPVLLDYKDNNGKPCYNTNNFDPEKKTIVFFSGYKKGAVANRLPDMRLNEYLKNQDDLTNDWENTHNFVLSDDRHFMDITPFPWGVLEAQKNIWTTPKRFKTKSGKYAENQTLKTSLCEHYTELYLRDYAPKIKNEVWFVGHSLGFQIASCVAWRLSLAQNLTSGGTIHQPKVLMGLGVYFSAQKLNYMKEIFGQKLNPAGAISKIVDKLKEQNTKIGIIRSKPNLTLKAIRNLTSHRYPFDWFVKHIIGVVGDAGDDLIGKVAYLEVSAREKISGVMHPFITHVATHAVPVYYFFSSLNFHPKIGFSAGNFATKYPAIVSKSFKQDDPPKPGLKMSSHGSLKKQTRKITYSLASTLALLGLASCKFGVKQTNREVASTKSALNYLEIKKEIIPLLEKKSSYFDIEVKLLQEVMYKETQRLWGQFYLYQNPDVAQSIAKKDLYEEGGDYLFIGDAKTDLVDSFRTNGLNQCAKLFKRCPDSPLKYNKGSGPNWLSYCKGRPMLWNTRAGLGEYFKSPINPFSQTASLGHSCAKNINQKTLSMYQDSSKKLYNLFDDMCAQGRVWLNPFKKNPYIPYALNWPMFARIIHEIAEIDQHLARKLITGHIALAYQFQKKMASTYQVKYDPVFEIAASFALQTLVGGAAYTITHGALAPATAASGGTGAGAAHIAAQKAAQAASTSVDFAYMATVVALNLNRLALIQDMKKNLNDSGLASCDLQAADFAQFERDIYIDTAFEILSFAIISKLLANGIPSLRQSIKQALVSKAYVIKEGVISFAALGVTAAMPAIEVLAKIYAKIYVGIFRNPALKRLSASFRKQAKLMSIDLSLHLRRLNFIINPRTIDDRFLSNPATKEFLDVTTTLRKKLDVSPADTKTIQEANKLFKYINKKCTKATEFFLLECFKVSKQFDTASKIWAESDLSENLIQIAASLKVFNNKGSSKDLDAVLKRSGIKLDFSELITPQ